MKINLKTAQGSALLSALLIMSLVAIIVTAMSMRVTEDLYRAKLIIENDRQFLAQQAVHNWALNYLLTQPDIFSVNGNPVVASFPTASLDNQITLQGRIFDLQSRININDISDKNYFSLFTNLLHNSKTLSNAEVNQIIVAIQKVLSPNRDETQTLVDISELRLVAEISNSLYQNLAKNLIALPEQTAVNILNCSRLVLKSLGRGLKDTEINEIIEARASEDSVKKITLLLDKFLIKKQTVTFESMYFLSVATSVSPDLSQQSYVMYKRIKNKKEIKVEVVNSGLLI